MAKGKTRCVSYFASTAAALCMIDACKNPWPCWMSQFFNQSYNGSDRIKASGPWDNGEARLIEEPLMFQDPTSNLRMNQILPFTNTVQVSAEVAGMPGNCTG